MTNRPMTLVALWPPNVRLAAQPAAEAAADIESGPRKLRLAAQPAAAADAAAAIEGHIPEAPPYKPTPFDSFVDHHDLKGWLFD
jgi:hypothetical protein